MSWCSALTLSLSLSYGEFDGKIDGCDSGKLSLDQRIRGLHWFTRITR